MGRMIDKGRATLAGKAGEYHYGCPIDQALFGFKGVGADEVKELLSTSASDEEVVAWFNSHGNPKTAEEISDWSDTVEAMRPHDNPEKREWFAGECAKLGLDPAGTTLAEYLEADDSATFRRGA